MASPPEKKKGESKPPQITQHLKSASVNDGQQVTLKCTVKCK